MKIKSIYISAFGSLKDLKLDFDDGFIVLYGENEAGKTTITEFIKAMFYGTGRRAAGKTMSIREQYTPFDGTQPGGRVYFEHAGKEYCLERQFRKSDATDKITVTDLLSGKSEPAASDIGKSLFGITMPAFERSVFIGNTPDFSVDIDAFGEINQKLSNAALTDDGVSYTKVLSRIDDARRNLVSKSGKAGGLIADINEYNALMEAQGESDRAAHKKQELSLEIENADKKLAEIEAEYEKVQKLLDRAKDIENTQKLKEYLELKESLDNVTRKLTLADGTVADEMFLKKFEFGFSKLDNMREKIENAKGELEALKKAAAAREGNSPDAIREKIESAKEEFARCENARRECEAEIQKTSDEIEALGTEIAGARDRKKAVNIPLLVAGIFLIAAGIIAYFITDIAGKTPIAAAVGGAGIVLALLGFIFRPKDDLAFKKAEEKLNLAQNELSRRENKLLMLSGEKNNIEAKIENLNISLNFGVNEEQKIKDTEELIERESERLTAEQKKVLKFFGLPEDTDIEKIKTQTEALYGAADEQKQIKIQLSYLSRDLGGVSYDEAKERLAAAGEEANAAGIEEIKEKAKLLAAQKSEAENLKTRLQTELKTGFRGMRDPEDLRRESALLKEKIEAKRAYFNAADTAYEVLSDSIITARGSFGTALENKMLKNFKAITDDAYGAVTVSSDFDISAEKNGLFGMHSVEYLSRGTKDQAYLALRLAVADLITEKEKLPVILDDSLSQYDDKRFLSALKFLKEYSCDTQICLFTCHNFVVIAAEKEGIKTVKI